MGYDKQTTTGLMFLALICTSTILPVLAAPPPQIEARKYVTKSNNIKKVYHKQQQQMNDIDIKQPESSMPQNKINEILQSSSNGLVQQNGDGNFPWALVGPMVQLVKLFMGVPNDGNSLTGNSIDKMDNGNSSQGFSWGQAIGYALKLLFAAMGGNNQHDGIDKNDVVGAQNPMQNIMKTLIGHLVGNEDSGQSENMAKQAGELINLAIALMNALKTSFSQRALRARSLGAKDRMTDITIAAIDMGKAYAKTFNTSDEQCRKQHICQAARECVDDLGQPNAFGLCHFTAYATANLMYYTQPSNEDLTKSYMEASRKGRSLEDCRKYYVCNEAK